MPTRRRKIVVDESVSAAELERAERAAKQKGLALAERLRLATEHPGVSDAQILHRILDRTTLFVTNDRPLHNEVLRRGLESLHVDAERVTDRPLPGIHRKKQYFDAPRKADAALGYRPPATPIRAALMPESPRQLKRWRVKRRRIRNHFGGMDHLDEVAITASWIPHRGSILIGVVARVSARVAVKAINASESYIAEPWTRRRADFACLCHALILPIRLNLHPVRTTVYFDALRMGSEIDAVRQQAGEEDRDFLTRLTGAFADLRFVASPKGERIERLRRKLRHLAAQRKANEIVAGDLRGLMERAAAFEPQESAGQAAAEGAGRDGG